MSEVLPKRLQRLLDLTSDHWNDRNPSHETVEKHFEQIETEAKNAGSKKELDLIKEFAEKSCLHFRKLIGGRNENLEDKVEKEYEKTIEKIKKRYNELRTIGTKTVVKIPGVVEVEKEKTKQPVIPKDENTA